MLVTGVPVSIQRYLVRRSATLLLQRVDRLRMNWASSTTTRQNLERASGPLSGA